MHPCVTPNTYRKKREGNYSMHTSLVEGAVNTFERDMANRGVINIVPTNMELTCGSLDGSWITGTEMRHFHIFLPFHASITRVNKQIILQTKI